MSMDEHRRALLGGELMTVREAAQFLNVSESTVRRWIAEDVLGCFQFPSGTIRVSGIHLENFLAQRVVDEAESVTASETE
jgi:excisionase family DNA binding protein